MGFSRQEYWSGVPSPFPKNYLGPLKISMTMVALIYRASLVAQLVKNPLQIRKLRYVEK